MPNMKRFIGLMNAQKTVKQAVFALERVNNPGDALMHCRRALDSVEVEIERAKTANTQ